MKKWIVAQAALRVVPGGTKLCDMPFGVVVDPTGNLQEITYSGLQTVWAEVVYTSSVRTYRGWTYSAFLEDYDPEDHPPIVHIPHQTENPQDAAQYMVWLNRVQYNLCGELCVCHLAHCDLGTMLEEWEAKAPSIYNNVFYGGRARTTGLPDLRSMLSIFGYSELPTLADGLRDPVLERALVTPQRMEKMLQEHQAIVGVRIETYLGRLKPSGVGHWVVLNNVYPHGINGGAVEIYNPFSNQMEGYSWAEFTASMGAPLGLWVKRR